VEHGIAMFVSDETVGPAELGRLAEAYGFESLWVPEHTHQPLEPSMHPVDGRVRDGYARTLDPFVALTAAAVATTRLRVGTGVSLVAQHDPIATAKAIATLDTVSGGRFELGVGAGWHEREMRNHGVDPATRFARMREHVLAMRAIWEQEVAEFHGRFVDFGPLRSWPKPVQPRLPVLMGGQGPKALDRVLEYADGWAPSQSTVEQLTPRIAELRERAAGVARPISVTVFLSGAPDAGIFAAYAALGVERVVSWVEPGDAGEAERSLQQLATVAGLR
jgi:probable F420-dependent oxidoreductase